jgi:hypothetical protein
MPDTIESLMAERKALGDLLASWWRRWEAAYRERYGLGDAAAYLKPLDDVARQQPPDTASEDPAPPAGYRI